MIWLRLFAYRLYLSAQVLVTAVGGLFLLWWITTELHDRHVAKADLACFSQKIEALTAAAKTKTHAGSSGLVDRPPPTQEQIDAARATLGRQPDPAAQQAEVEAGPASSEAGRDARFDPDKYLAEKGTKSPSGFNGGSGHYDDWGPAVPVGEWD